jgi:hypothetical protein
MDARLVKVVNTTKDMVAIEIFTTPEDVRKALESQGDYPEICITVQIPRYNLEINV